MPRLFPLDALRGLIMIVMALDHANAFIARGKLGPELWAGQFPNYQGDALAFFTRFVTHLAAPGFFFLLGVGSVLFAGSRRQQGWSTWRIMRHLTTRGALLILLQFLVEDPAWRVLYPDMPLYLGVLCCLGATMIGGALLLHLPAGWVAGLSMLAIVSTEVVLWETSAETIRYPLIMRLLWLPGQAEGLYVLYPLVPWLGVMGLGMAYGRWLEQDRARAYRGALGLGMVAILLFIPVRLLGGLGNIRPMPGSDWIAFLNVVKYPPSIVFLLLTLGADLVLLGLFARVCPAAERGLWPLAVLGQVPLFFYLTHLYLYAFMGQWIAPRGTGILQMYPYWLLGLVLLFPLCWWYGRFKHNRPPDSWWRLL